VILGGGQAANKDKAGRGGRDSGEGDKRGGGEMEILKEKVGRGVNDSRGCQGKIRKGDESVQER